jgi:hypothetical protein
MIIKALILTTLLTNDPTTMIIAMPPDKIEARKRHGKGDRGRRRGGNGLR